MSEGSELLGFVGKRKFATILADPPWQSTNKTGKIAGRAAAYRAMKRSP